MDNLGFGLEMTLAGMGSVFAILALLMVVLLVIGRLDRTPSAPAVAAAEPVAEVTSPVAPHVRINAAGLTDDQLAAIAIAVITHADVRRKQAAPAMRVRQPGSQLHTNRWTTVGRGLQTQIHHQRRR